MKISLVKTSTSYILILNPDHFDSRRIICDSIEEALSLIEEYYATT